MSKNTALKNLIKALMDYYRAANKLEDHPQYRDYEHLTYSVVSNITGLDYSDIKAADPAFIATLESKEA